MSGMGNRISRIEMITEEQALAFVKRTYGLTEEDLSKSSLLKQAITPRLPDSYSEFVGVLAEKLNDEASFQRWEDDAQVLAAYHARQTPPDEAEGN